MRYEAEWLLESLLLRIKSVSAYEHIRRLKLLPLPSCSTLRRLLSGVSCHFGFNTAALQAIETIMEGKCGRDLSVIVSFDEVALTPQPNFNQESLAIDGFVNLSVDPVYNRDEMDHHDEAEGPRLEPEISDTPVLADHALVFMVRPLLASWVQPFGVFASAGAASGDDLYRLVIAAIIRLEARRVRVLAAVSDGASTNMKFWKLAGAGIDIEGQKEIVKNEFPYPLDPDRSIYVLQDPPHAFKCVRNQLYNHDTVQVCFL